MASSHDQLLSSAHSLLIVTSRTAQTLPRNTISPLHITKVTPLILAALNSKRSRGLELVEKQPNTCFQAYIHRSCPSMILYTWRCRSEERKATGEEIIEKWKCHVSAW